MLLFFLKLLLHFAYPFHVYSTMTLYNKNTYTFLCTLIMEPNSNSLLNKWVKFYAISFSLFRMFQKYLCNTHFMWLADIQKINVLLIFILYCGYLSSFQKSFILCSTKEPKKKHHRCDKYIFLWMKMRARVLLWNNNEFDLAKREPFVFSQRLLLIEVIQMKRYVNRVFKPKCHTQSKYHSQYHSQYRHRTQSGYSK